MGEGYRYQRGSDYFVNMGNRMDGFELADELWTLLLSEHYNLKRQTCLIGCVYAQLTL